MSTKIIDKLAPPQKSPSRIQLVACLQDGRNKEGNLYFYGDTYPTHKHDEIARVGQINNGSQEYDVIIADNGVLYLGYWNDGVL